MFFRSSWPPTFRTNGGRTPSCNSASRAAAGVGRVGSGVKKSGSLAVPIVTTWWGGRPSSRRQSIRVHSEIVRSASYRRSAEIVAWYRRRSRSFGR